MEPLRTNYTLIIPYYNQLAMLRKQLDEIRQYPDEVSVIVVDDGSPEPAEQVFTDEDRASLYRIEVDIPWNREQARNLGAYVTETEWLIQVDIDHVLPAQCAEKLVAFLNYAPENWYRFPRFRRGAADFTRKKDTIHHRKKHGKIHPHIDSYLITRDRFLSSPYDERYAGSLGGGSPFLDRMTQKYGEPPVIASGGSKEGIYLEVHTTDSVEDASITTLSRDKSEYIRKRKEISDAAPAHILMHPWHKVR